MKKVFKRTIRDWITRFKIVDTWKYSIISHDDNKYYFKLSPKEYEEAKDIYKEKGTISYEFYPCAGIGWGVRIHTKDKDVYDITDVSTW